MIGTEAEAVIYCRVSSIKQTRVGDGLKSQETRCRDFARMKNYDVSAIFTDDVSGGRADRPGMKDMLAYLRARRSKGVVVIIDDVSRLARGIEAHIQLRRTIAMAGGKLESPSIEFGDDSDSQLVEMMMATVSQYQRQKNGEQTKHRMRARVQNGYWVFQAPVGYRYQRVPGRGQMLVRDEPAASAVQEALEGYASGRFETQADVMRFLQANPLFPKDKSGLVRNQRVAILLKQACYAGYVEAPSWGVPRRLGQHEPLISYETFQRVQDRLNGVNRAPKRRNLNEEFPLRGFVACDECDSPLTSCWSKGRTSLHPYYLCHNRDCASYGKSIRRDVIEGEFEAMLQTLQPSERLFKVARAMFEDLWNHRLAQAQTHRKALADEVRRIEGQVAQLLDRIIDARVPSVIAAYEDKVRKLEEEKLLIVERMASAGRPARTFGESLRTALDFLANPWNLWVKGGLEDRRTVLKLAFARRLNYRRGEGFRTANLALPFNILGAFSGGKVEMARPIGFEPMTFGSGGRRSIH